MMIEQKRTFLLELTEDEVSNIINEVSYMALSDTKIDVYYTSLIELAFNLLAFFDHPKKEDIVNLHRITNEKGEIDEN